MQCIIQLAASMLCLFLEKAVAVSAFGVDISNDIIFLIKLFLNSRMNLIPGGLIQDNVVAFNLRWMEATAKGIHSDQKSSASSQKLKAGLHSVVSSASDCRSRDCKFSLNPNLAI